MASGHFVSIYDQNLDFPSDVNYYLGSREQAVEEFRLVQSWQVVGACSHPPLVAAAPPVFDFLPRAEHRHGTVGAMAGAG